MGIRRTRLKSHLFIAAGIVAAVACQDQRGLPKEALDWSNPRPVSDPFEVRHAAIEGDSLVVHLTTKEFQLDFTESSIQGTV